MKFSMKKETVRVFANGCGDLMNLCGFQGYSRH